VGPDGAVLRLRGINLGNWLVPEGYMWRFEKGNYRLLTPEDRPGVWLDEGFALLDRVTSWCREEGLCLFKNVRVNAGYVRALGLLP